MMMRKILIISALMILSLPMTVGAMNVKRVADNVVLNNVVDSKPAIYVIEGDCMLSGDVSLAAGSVLKFEGGMIGGSGKIAGNRLMIDAPQYKIFGDNVRVGGIANGEVSAHWWGALGDGITYDCTAINRALRDAGTSWVVLDNLRYMTSGTIVMSKNQRLKCAGILSYCGSGAAIDIQNTDVEIDIRELRHSAGTGNNQPERFKGSGVLFSGNVFNANINIDRMLYFDRAFDMSPKHSKTDNVTYRGIQYCKISWQYVVAQYGIYMDMVSGMLSDGKARHTWINENQFDGGRLLCKYGVFSTPVDDKYRDKIDVINGNVFNCIGFEGEGAIKCKAVTLYNAWHNEFRNIRLSEGYVPIGQPWIDLTQCGYLKFSFKSQIPYSSIKATRCNHIEMHGTFTDDGLGYMDGYDRLYILNENPSYNPLGKLAGEDSQSVKLLTRSQNATSEIKRVYVGITSDNPRGGVLKTINYNDLFYSYADGRMALSDKCFISVYDRSTLVVKAGHALTNAYLGMKLVCEISAGSKIEIINPAGKKMSITEGGVYHVRPLNDGFELYMERSSGYKILRFQ